MSKYPSTNITLSSLEDKGLTVKIKDSEGRSWHVWKADYNNKAAMSDAWEALQQIKIGESFGVKYGEKEESYNGKNYTKRTIYEILPVVANPTEPSKINPLYNKAEKRPEIKDNRFWEQQAYEKCCSLWAAEYEDVRLAIDAIESGKFWELFQAIKADGKKRFFEFSGTVGGTKTDFATKESEPLPTVDINEDLGEDIPF
jgi:hypothetical protein